MLCISNFMLDLHNKTNVMKKTRTALILVLSGAVAFTTAIWIYSTKTELATFHYVAFAAVFFVVAVSLVIGLRRLRNQRRGLTVDDELSRRIKERAAAQSFVFSFYIWLMLMLFTDDLELSVTALIGIGIILNGLLFFGLLYFNTRNGIDIENPS